MATNLDNNQQNISTKQKILNSAAHLFAMKGYTETTIREIAASIGLTEASIYNYFPSKNDILECILEEYAQLMASVVYKGDRLNTLGKDLTADDIMSCLTLVFPEGKEEYFLTQLCVVLHEQYRNPVVRKFVTEHIFYNSERVFTALIDRMKELNVLRQDTDADLWAKLYSSLIYTFCNRVLLGIGDINPGFTGMGMYKLIHSMCVLMLEICGTGNDQGSPSELSS